MLTAETGRLLSNRNIITPTLSFVRRFEALTEINLLSEGFIFYNEALSVERNVYCIDIVKIHTYLLKYNSLYNEANHKFSIENILNFFQSVFGYEAMVMLLSLTSLNRDNWGYKNI